MGLCFGGKRSKLLSLKAEGVKMYEIRGCKVFIDLNYIGVCVC